MMRQLPLSIFAQAVCLLPIAFLHSNAQTHPQTSGSAKSISTALFADLERLSRLVDISYCIGNTGVRKPFDCLSRCKDFPGLSLQTTWSTGPLMGDSCGYIAVDEDESTGAIVVAFRGTYSIANTVVDLSTVPQEYVPYPAPKDGEEASPNATCDNCTVHMGFWQSWQTAREIVLPELKALKKKHPSYSVKLVGHSLGGAVACLAALELKLSLGWKDVVVTTFGEPRVGNGQLAHFIDRAFRLDDPSEPEQRVYRRVTHNNDPVPLLPLEEWGYRPHGGEIFIAKQELQPTEDDVRTCVGDSDPECSIGAESGIFGGTIRRLLHFASASNSIEEFIGARNIPTRFKLWQLFFAHRDYFWRLGLCVPGGDPANWRGGHWFADEASEEL